MRKLGIILMLSLLLVSCKSPNNSNITGLNIINNEYSLDYIKKTFPNLKTITFTSCDMSKYDMGNFEIYIREVIIGKDCYGELICSDKNHMINKIELNDSNISSIRSTFIDNLPDIEELSSFNTNIKEISFSQNTSIVKLDIFNASINDFTSLCNLENLKELRISQLHFDDEFDVSFISKLKNIESLHLSSNFRVDPLLNYQNIKKIGIVSKEQSSQSLEKLLCFSTLESLVIMSYYNTKFPQYLEDLPNLTSLILVNTDIEYFPIDLSRFTKLTNLEFINHSVTAFPDQVIFPKSLKTFYINGDAFPLEYFTNTHPDIHFEILEI